MALLRSVKLLSVAGKAAEAAIASTGGRLSSIEPVSERDVTIASRGVEPSSEAGCAAPSLSDEL